MPKTVRFFLPAIFLITAAFAGPFFSLSSSARPQRLVTTTTSSRNAALVAAQSGAVARPSGKAQQDPVAIKTARNAALVAATNEVLKETSEIRQLSILRPVQSSAQSRAEIERMIMKNLNEETTPAQMHAAEVTLKKLGLAPQDFHYRALMVRLLTEQVAGYYDPKTGEFHLADWIDLDGQRPIMAHELTHALQDQHFNLRRFEHWPKGDSDAELAAHALIEGDATLAMALYVANNPLRALAFLKSLGTARMSSAELEKAPRALRETLLFPYQEGTNWTRSLYKQGGWDRISKAFTELPQSTEQILHPEKYFAHEAPVKVILPDITNLLNKSERAAMRSVPPALAGGFSGADLQPGSGRAFAGSVGISSAFNGTDFHAVKPNADLRTVSGYALTGNADVWGPRQGSPDWVLDPAAPSAQREQFRSAATRRRFSLSVTQPQGRRATWKRLDYDVQGEWGFYLLLDEFLKSPAESRRAAAGWGGDRFAVYEGPKGEVLIASLSVWDTENDAREFFDAYVKRTELRYPDATLVNTSSQSGVSKRWQTSEGMVTIDLRGSRVLILEGVPNSVDSNLVIRSLGQ